MFIFGIASVLIAVSKIEEDIELQHLSASEAVEIVQKHEKNKGANYWISKIELFGGDSLLTGTEPIWHIQIESERDSKDHSHDTIVIEKNRSKCDSEIVSLSFGTKCCNVYSNYFINAKTGSVIFTPKTE